MPLFFITCQHYQELQYFFLRYSTYTEHLNHGCPSSGKWRGQRERRKIHDTQATNLRVACHSSGPPGISLHHHAGKSPALLHNQCMQLGSTQLSPSPLLLSQKQGQETEIGGKETLATTRARIMVGVARWEPINHTLTPHRLHVDHRPPAGQRQPKLRLKVL